MEHGQTQFKNYFLGNLSEEEIAETEMQILADQEFAETMEIVETDLIEEYLDSELSADDRKSFEEKYLTCEPRLKKVEFLKSVKKFAESQSITKEPMPSFFETLKTKFNLRPLTLAFGAIALICAVSVTSYFVWGNYYGKSDVLIALSNYQKQINERPTEGRPSGFPYAPSEGKREGKEKQMSRDLERANYLVHNVGDNPTAEELHDLGRFYLVEKDFDKAIVQFEEAIKINPNISKIHNDLGVALLEKWKLAKEKLDENRAEYESKNESSKLILVKAGNEFSKTIELDKTSFTTYFIQGQIEPYFNLALCLQFQELPNQAEEAWKTYLKLDSTSKWADEARRNLKIVESQKPISKNRDEILRNFQTAQSAGDDGKAWQILSNNREMIENKLIPQQIASLFINAKLNKNPTESQNYLNLLNYAGSLEEQNSKDLYWKDVADFYGKLESEKQIITLKKAHDSLNKGFEFLRNNKWKDATDEFADSQKQFLEADDLPESKIPEFWISYPLFLDHKYEESFSALKPIAEYANRRNYKWLNSQALGWLGINSGNLNRFSQEIDFYKKSLVFAEETSDLYNLQKINGQTADFYLQSGQFQEALHFAEKISQNPIVEDTSIRQKLRSYDVLSRLYFSMGFNELSANYKKEGLVTWSENNPDKIFPWLNLTDLAVIYGKQGKYNEAYNTIEKARRAANSFEGSSVRIAYVDLQEAQIKRFANDCQGAIKSYNKAIEFYDSTEFQPHRYTAHKGKLICLQTLKDNKSFENELNTVLGILQEYRKDIVEDSTEMAFFDSEQIVYDSAIYYELDNGNSERALNYSEESRSRSLLDLVNGKSSTAQMPLRFEMQLPDVSIPLSVNEIRPQLPDDLQIVQYAVLSDKVVVWSFSKDSFDFAKVDISAEELQKYVDSYLKIVSEPNDENLDEEIKFSKKLYEILINPIESSLANKKTVAFIPDKFLFKLPFAALKSPTDAYLISKYGITYSSSLNVFLKCSNNSKTTDSNRAEKILAVGNPLFSAKLFPDLKKLKSAGIEAGEIKNFYDPSSIILSGKDATKESVTKEFSKADVVHIASHYSVNNFSMLSSGLILASTESTKKKQDSILSNYEVYEVFKNDFSNVKLVILAACDTGVESVRKGEGPIGSARAFLAAGVPQVVASQWSVDSGSTSDLMIHFHQYRKKEKLSTIDALRKSQLDLLESDDFNRPYYWAAFAVTGGYSQR
jgi:CHAT domain-containing protein